MSFNLNKVNLAGRLTRDPEVRFLDNSRAVCSFGLAVNGDNTATSLTSSECRMRTLYGASSSSNGNALDIRYASAMYMGDLA